MTHGRFGQIPIYPTMAKRTGNTSGNTSSALNSAKKAKNGEFYTQRSDIENELRH